MLPGADRRDWRARVLRPPKTTATRVFRGVLTIGDPTRPDRVARGCDSRQRSGDGVQRGQDVGDQIGGVLDAAGEPDQTRPGRRRPTARAGRPWCAGRRTRSPRSPAGTPAGTAPPPSAEASVNVTTPGMRRICLAPPHRTDRGSRPGQRTACTAGCRAQRLGHRGRVLALPGAAAGPACPATGAPATPRSCPGCRRSSPARPAAAASSAGSRVAT